MHTTQSVPHAPTIYPIYFFMMPLSRTYATLNLLQEEPKSTPLKLNLRELSPLVPTQSFYPSKLAPPAHLKLEPSLYRKALTSYLKKTAQGQEFLHGIKKRHTNSQVIEQLVCVRATADDLVEI